jgi:hypothetical protein
MEKPNLNYIQNISQGDKVFEEKLINILKSEFHLDQKSYFQNVKQKKYAETAENVHKIRHKISILGIDKGNELASNYEKNLRGFKSKGKDEFESILNLISKFLESI